MALLKFGAIVTEGSGSLGGHTIQNSKGGVQLRTKPIPHYNPSASQTLIRSFNPILQSAWRTLSDLQRENWNLFAEQFRLSGHSLWMRYQFYQLFAGFEIDPVPSRLPWPHGPSYPSTLKDTSKTYGWYKADDLASITKDGSNLVSMWKDQNNMVNLSSSGTGRPLWSLGKLTFNDNYLAGGYAPVSAPFTIWLVIKPLSYINGKVFYSLYGTAEFKQYGGAGDTIMYGTTYGPQNSITAPHKIARQEWNGAASKNIVADFVVSGNPGAAAGNSFILGNNYLLTGWGVVFEIEELINRKQVDSPGDIIDINNYLKGKFSL